MDTSKKYILMCEMAGEIQKEWFPKVGDWFYSKSMPDVSAGPAIREFNANEGEIWLPRQDQLQEMVIKEGGGTCIALIGASHLMAERLNHYIFDSFEQLWLAYLMHNRYQKEWDNEKWINSVKSSKSFAILHTI